jgi:hypothetical protein
VIGVAPPVDAEALLVAYLRGRADVTALAGARISTRLPADFPASGPAVRVTLVSHTPANEAARLWRAHLQAHCYGNGPSGPEAWRLTSAVMGATLEIPDTPGLRDGVVVTAARIIVGAVADIDEPTGTAGYRFSAMLHLHRG